MARTNYIPGDRVPSHFDPDIVAGSYIASLCGCILAIELLHRRATGFYNLRSWCDTFMCATALGLVGIWCMHFIGNRAIVLGSGQPDLQLVYDSGYSTLSVFLPIIGLSIAFSAAEYPFRSNALQWVALICTGIFAGLSIVGMHYMGNFGIRNYKLNYETRFFTASIIIAIGDCLTVLLLFYTLREKWISRWQRRAVCAAFLAGGISAMHFTASTKCIYILRSYNSAAERRSRNIQVIIAGVLCGTAAAIVFGVLFFTRHRSRVRKRSSQKVMLACAMFDPDGRLLVTTEGILPAREITNKFNAGTFGDDFDQAHPAFQWMFRVSRNWSCVSELIPKMKHHIGTKSPDGGENPAHPTSCFFPDTSSPSESSINFRERFCIAAASLASSFYLSVKDIGVLYDDIVDTGTLEKKDRTKTRNTLDIELARADLESSSKSSDFGRGQLLFLTRRLNAGDVERMVHAGFKFGSVQQVGRNIADIMQIPLPTLEGHVTRVKKYVDNLLMAQKEGTWLSCFAMIPKPNSKGFDVAVRKTAEDQLPDVQLLPSEPVGWQTSFLSRMHNKTMPNCLDFLKDPSNFDPLRAQQEQQFALDVIHAITALNQQLPSRWLQSSRFYGQPVYAYYSQPFRGAARATTLFSFVVCADPHVSIESHGGITGVPLSFFNIRHQYGSANHLALAREIHKEFGPVLARYKAESRKRAKKSSIHTPYTSSPRKTPTVLQSSSIGCLSLDDQSDDSSEVYEPIEFQNSFGTPSSKATMPPAHSDDHWGGILVNSETVVSTEINNELYADSHSIGPGNGPRVAVGTPKPEATFVDELCTFARRNISTKGVF